MDNPSRFETVMHLCLLTISLHVTLCFLWLLLLLLMLLLYLCVMKHPDLAARSVTDVIKQHYIDTNWITNVIKLSVSSFLYAII